MSDKSYRLTVRKGPQEGQSYALVATMVTIGRDPMADIVITDPEVSRQHVRFTRTNGGYEIQDLGSTNGTFIDGRRLTGEAHPLSPGQEIIMGSNVTLVYEEVGAPMATVLSPEGDALFPEEEVEEPGSAEVRVYDAPEIEADDYGTVLEMGDEAPTDLEGEAAPETSPLGFEEVTDEEEVGTTFDFPDYEEEEVADFGEEAGTLPPDDELPSFEANDELPDFDAAPPAPAYGDTILESDYEEAPGETEDDLPDFDAGTEPSYTKETESYVPPPPDPPGAPPAGSNRNRNIIIGVVALLFLLCCCCLFLALAWNYGDALITGVNQIQ